MLSKKMAFSLTSLITIFALALVSMPAMSADITVEVKLVAGTNVYGDTAMRSDGYGYFWCAGRSYKCYSRDYCSVR